MGPNRPDFGAQATLIITHIRPALSGTDYPYRGLAEQCGGRRFSMRIHKDLILGRAEITGISGRRCRVRIICGRTPGTFHWLEVGDVRLEMVEIGAEGRLVIRTDRSHDGIRYFLLPD
jgi:hypothetical protein